MIENANKQRETTTLTIYDYKDFLVVSTELQESLKLYFVLDKTDFKLKTRFFYPH